MTSTVIYKGALRTEMKHLQSGSIIENDAPPWQGRKVQPNRYGSHRIGKLYADHNGD